MKKSTRSSGSRKRRSRTGRMTGRIRGASERSPTLAETALERSEHRYRHLVENSLGLICTHDLEGMILSVNPAAATSLGYNPQDGPGRSLKDFLAPETRHLFDQYLERVRKNGSDAGLMRVRARSGAERVWMYRNILYREPDGRAYVLGHALDVTERVLAERALRESQRQLTDAYAQLDARVQQRTAELQRVNIRLSAEIAERTRAEREAQEANRLKDDFLATLSHELRTPLSAILGWAHILQKRVIDQYTARGLAVIERNAEAQTRLTEDILDVARIASGKLLLNLEPVDLCRVAGAAVDGIRPEAQAKGVHLIDRSKPVNVVVEGDSHRLQQVVSNLLSNAVKFTPPGGTVSLEVRRTEGCASLTVVDSGIGMRPDVLPFIFDRFRQADSSSIRAHGGLGLGLAIVRNLVERHGGTVTASSAGTAEGSTFTVTLPVRIGSEPPVEPESPRPDSPRGDGAPTAVWELSLRGRLVLVVEDQADARELIREIIQGAGADVITAATSREALDVLARSTPHLIVADIGLPEEDGYQLIRRVRELHPEGGGIPAIALTAYAHTEDRAQALTAGFQQYLVKPVDPDTLVRTAALTLGASSAIEV